MSVAVDKQKLRNARSELYTIYSELNGIKGSLNGEFYGVGTDRIANVLDQVSGHCQSVRSNLQSAIDRMGAINE